MKRSAVICNNAQLYKNINLFQILINLMSESMRCPQKPQAELLQVVLFLIIPNPSHRDLVQIMSVMTH